MTVRTISKSQLKANLLKIFQEIELTGEELIVTDHSKPVLRILPIEKKLTVEEIFGPQRSKAILYEDPNIPTIDEWTEV